MHTAQLVREARAGKTKWREFASRSNLVAHVGVREREREREKSSDERRTKGSRTTINTHDRIGRAFSFVLRQGIDNQHPNKTYFGNERLEEPLGRLEHCDCLKSVEA